MATYFATIKAWSSDSSTYNAGDYLVALPEGFSGTAGVFAFKIANGRTPSKLLPYAPNRAAFNVIFHTDIPAASGITGPGTTTNGAIVVWTSTNGTTIGDGPLPSDFVQDGDDATVLGSGAQPSGQVLESDGAGGTTWVTPAAGGGDVVGPASATDNAAVRFDGTTGKLIQNGVVTIGDTGAVAGVLTLNGSTPPAAPGTLATLGANLNLFGSGAAGAGEVPSADGAGNVNWGTPATGGDVSGPGAPVVSDNIVTWSGTSGQDIQDSGLNLSEIIEEDPGAGTGLIESGPGASPIILKNVADGDATDVQANTGSFQINVRTTQSIVIDGTNNLALSGDATTPGNSRYYGTDSGGTKGYFALPADTGITELTGGVTAGPGSGSQVATVVTNANLTGPITSVGNATTVADPELAAIAALTSAANKTIQYTGSGTAALADLKLGVEAAYTGTPTFTAGAAPSGTANLRQFYTHIGNLVTWQISLTYATTGTTVTNVSLTFPTEFPTPAIPTGFTGASVKIWPCPLIRCLSTPSGTIITSAGYGIYRNAGDTGFEISGIAFSSGSYRTFQFYGTYFTA